MPVVPMLGRPVAERWAITLLLLTLVVVIAAPSYSKVLARRDPRDGALDSTLIIIVRQQLGRRDTFQVEETFLGNLVKGDPVQLPGFELKVADERSVIGGVERVEPITPETRILVFLKPGKAGSGWQVAGFGNCYFWSHDPTKLDSLRAMAHQASELRRAWETARLIPDERERVRALWPYLWNEDGACRMQTKAELQKIGGAAGDYIAEQWGNLSYNQKNDFLWDAGGYGSASFHTVLLNDLKKQQQLWTDMLVRRGGFATYRDVDPPGRTHVYPRRPEDADADLTDDVNGELYWGLHGLGTFHDKADLPFIREAAMWGIKYGFTQLCDGALDCFEMMPERANLPVIEAIWQDFLRRGNKADSGPRFEVMKTLNAHRFPEAIPLMAQFVNVGFAHDMAQQFLADLTGKHFGADKNAWLNWYAQNKARLGVRD